MRFSLLPAAALAAVGLLLPGLVSATRESLPELRRTVPESFIPKETGHGLVADADLVDEGVSPVPTSPPRPEFGEMELVKRLTGYTMGTDTCGFVASYWSNAFTCVRAGATCSNDGQYIGCCSTGTCTAIKTQCIPYSASLSGACNSTTGAAILCCSTSTRDLCYSYTFSTTASPGRILTMVNCDTKSGVGLLLDYPPEFTRSTSSTSPTSTLLRTTSSTSSSSSSRTSSSSTTTTTQGSAGANTGNGSGSQESSQSAPVGAIAGGVVGGVAVIGLAAAGIFLMVRRSKRKDAAASSSSGGGSPGVNPGSPPGPGGVGPGPSPSHTFPPNSPYPGGPGSAAPPAGPYGGGYGYNPGAPGGSPPGAGVPYLYPPPNMAMAMAPNGQPMMHPQQSQWGTPPPPGAPSHSSMYGFPPSSHHSGSPNMQSTSPVPFGTEQSAHQQQQQQAYAGQQAYHPHQMQGGAYPGPQY